LEDNSREHIGTAELAKLLEESRERPESAMDAPGVHPHLAACVSCREQYEGLVLLDRQLKSMKPVESAPYQGDCPGPTVWREVAGGLTPPEETLARIEHASRCGHCGPLLQRAVAELAALNGEMTEAEQKHIATLESARAEWQRRLAQRIIGTKSAGPGRESASGWQRQLATPRLALAAAFFLAAIAVGSWVVLQRNQPETALRLLARAYAEKRTLEPRIAGTIYAPLRVSRGPSASFTNRPAPLLRAEVLIATQLESHPSDPLWLQAQAQADLLEGRYAAAVDVLRHALQLESRSPALLTDLATAYFQRAQEGDRKEDFGAAFENLSEALNLRPDDPVALFNRAIVSEHQFLYRQALDDWDHYLRLDPGSQWAEEARTRANAVREKLKQLGRELTPLLSPAQLVAQGASASVASEVEARVEEYLHEAIRSWLPQAFPEGRASADANAAPALFFLADLTSRQQGDRWLADLLRRSSAPNFPQAANALARAIKANDAGNDDVSRQQADLAEQSFRASGNAAGVLRARFERSFAAQIERRSDECRREAATALTESEKQPYPWLQIQLGLEKSVCSNLMSDIGTSKSAAQQAMDKARENKYGALYLRALGFVVDDYLATGDKPGGLRLANAGLERYWSAQYPLMRGYNLYAELAYSAEAAGQPSLRAAVWREALALIDSDENLLLRAAANRATADAATDAHQPRTAQQRYAEAARLFALAPRTEANHINSLENEIRTARVDVHQVRFDDALARLTRIQDQIRPLSNNYLAQIFYSTLGELQLGRHREAEAEQALRPALALAEQSLATLGSEAERTSWSKDAAPAYLALVEAELAQGRSQEALETYEWYLGAPQRVAANPKVHPSAYQPIPNPPPEPSAVASHLALLAEETVLAYALLPDGLAIWVYDDRGINSCWIPKPTDALQELAGRFNDLASDPGSESRALRRDARSLYDLLIGPVERYLTPGRTLVFETEGWLANVPFEALLDTHDHYLIERVPVVHSLGRDSQARLHRDTGISADSISLVVGSTVSSSAHELIPLPNILAEADAVGRSFHSARLLKGRDASLGAVNNALPAAAVFHFAGHSLATSDRDGLLLEPISGKAEPQLLDADQLRHMPLQSLQLAVLSACNTGERSGSHGFNSVTEALVRAGVPHVVASRWAVDSVESRVFVEDFYSNLLSGEPVSEAIRITSRRMLSHPQTSHPYYWSAFAAYGKR
jgi:CHAT domain-containing protein